jgi:hypothetical protein
MKNERVTTMVPAMLLTVTLAFTLVAAAESNCAAISSRDAEILIYLMPVADQLRAEGMDIGWERQPTIEKQNPGAYAFWVYNSRRPSDGSITIGYYLVNKCTGVVREDETGEVVTSPVMERVRKIMTATGKHSRGAMRDATPSHR